ncbi:DUF202 domain-containing protein [Blastococcus sp. SYSU D00669]
MSEQVFDRGLQAERTALAWRRTALAMAVAAVGAGRLAAPVIGVLAVVLAAVGLVQAAFVGYRAERRYRSVHASLTTRGDLGGARAGGLPIAALALSGVAVGLLALAFALGPGL